MMINRLNEDFFDDEESNSIVSDINQDSDEELTLDSIQKIKESKPYILWLTYNLTCTREFLIDNYKELLDKTIESLTKCLNNYFYSHFETIKPIISITDDSYSDESDIIITDNEKYTYIYCGFGSIMSFINIYFPFSGKLTNNSMMSLIKNSFTFSNSSFFKKYYNDEFILTTLVNNNISDRTASISKACFKYRYIEKYQSLYGLYHQMDMKNYQYKCLKETYINSDKIAYELISNFAINSKGLIKSVGDYVTEYKCDDIIEFIKNSSGTKIFIDFGNNRKTTNIPIENVLSSDMKIYSEELWNDKKYNIYRTTAEAALYTRVVNGKQVIDMDYWVYFFDKPFYKDNNVYFLIMLDKQ